MFRLSSSPILVTIMLCYLLLSATIYAIESPQTIIKSAAEAMTSELNRDLSSVKKDPNIAYHLINKHLASAFNFNLIARYVLGRKHWKAASKLQQREFVSAFRRLVVRFYSKALLKYLNEKQVTSLKPTVRFLPEKEKIDKRYATVYSEVETEGFKSVTVKYDLRYSIKKKKWQVYDLSVEGVSLVTTYRSSFQKIISQQGINGLIQDIEKKLNQ